MQIIKTYGWMRRDFSYDRKCEGCGNVEANCSGYDDANYYDNVFPDVKCSKCNESTNSLGVETQSIATKYPSDLVI